MKTCVIIGGGIGGLVTGALLAKEGYRVTVLEKNALIGGGLQTFQRKGVSFPTGMHLFGGFQEGGNLRKLFGYLGVLDKITLCATDADASDVVIVSSDRVTYRLPTGRERFIAYLSGLFPKEKMAIASYVDRLFELSEEEDLFHLRETSTAPHPHSEDFLHSVRQLLDKYVTDAKLKALLTYLSPLVGSEGKTTPAYILALLSTLHINGTFQFVGESRQLADALAKLIEDTGGRVLALEEVTEIRVEDHKVSEVVTKRGNVYQADAYISDVHPDVLLRLFRGQAFTTAFVQRLQSIPETCSSFKVFIKFKKNRFPYLNHSNFWLADYDATDDFEEMRPDVWPRSLMYITPPVAHQSEYAETMVILSMMKYDWVRDWEDTQTGRRGEAYAQWKQTMMERLLDRMESLYPEFRSGIEFAFAASPLTIRDYYGNKEGSNYGFRKDSDHLMLSQMSVLTKVKNLLLTGQNVNIHGFCGVSLTAIETAEALVGHNAIVGKINNFCNETNRICNFAHPTRPTWIP